MAWVLHNVMPGIVCLITEVEHESDGRPWDWLVVYLEAWCCVLVHLTRGVSPKIVLGEHSSRKLRACYKN